MWGIAAEDRKCSRMREEKEGGRGVKESRRNFKGRVIDLRRETVENEGKNESWVLMKSTTQLGQALEIRLYRERERAGEMKRKNNVLCEWNGMGTKCVGE